MAKVEQNEGLVEKLVAVDRVAKVVKGVSSTSTLVNPLENYKRQRRAFRSSRLRLGHCTNLCHVNGLI
jgi:hypothetical protein